MKSPKERCAVRCRSAGASASAAANAAKGDRRAAAFAEHLKTHYLDRGRLGRESGAGFYRYRD
ncbi:MAG: hypothetical protein ACTHJL_12250, partial [Amnibacterium sp.]